MSLFSDHWYRVAALHPRLRSHVRIDRHRYRGEVWHLLKDPLTGRQHRLNELGWRVVARFDGRLSLQQIWDLLIAQAGEDAPTQAEVIALLARLHEAELIQTENTPDVAQLFASADRRRARQQRQRVNPLSLRVGLFDPTRLLDALAPLGRALMRPWALWAWAALAVLTLAALAPHGGELRAYAALHLGSPRMLLIMWLAYPVIKALHELAHALALRSWGGEVRDVGVSLLMLMPVPYVDASAASGLRSRRKRVLVSLMGILAETTLAALAAWLWLTVSDGVLRDIAFATMVVGGVSTLLFNGNPLMRFDAYHALCDAIESPALGTRGDAYWRYLWRRHALALAQARPPTVARGERPWLLGYAAASLAYRILVALWMVGWLLGVHLLLGALMAAWMLFVLLARPAFRLWRYTRDASELDGRRARAHAAHGLALLLPLALLLALPVPRATHASGVVWVDEKAMVRAQVDGFVERVAVTDGQQVSAGTLVLQLRDPALDGELERVHARLAGLDIAYYAALFQEPAKAAGVAQEMRRQEAERDRLQARIAALAVRSAGVGRIALRQPDDLPGSYIARGSLVAHLITAQTPTVRVLVSEGDVARLRELPRGIQVRLADAPTATQHATLIAQTPAPVSELPSPALGDRLGGPVLTDPADPDGMRPLEPMFVVDLALPGGTGGRIGTRAQVRFDHGDAPLAQQWLYRVQQLFVGRLPSATLTAGGHPIADS